MSAVPNSQPSRPWRDIARELAQATDHKRITELADELNAALEQQVLPNGRDRDMA